MKCIRFKLESNKKIIIDEVVNYFKKDNILNFKVKDDLYEYKINDEILVKKNNESTITIDFKIESMKIELHGMNQEFYMDISDVKIKSNDEIINLEYTFINDEKTTNCIIIEYR